MPFSSKGMAGPVATPGNMQSDLAPLSESAERGLVPERGRSSSELRECMGPSSIAVPGAQVQESGRLLDVWMDGWLVGWMDGWMDRRMDGWTDGWADGENERTRVQE